MNHVVTLPPSSSVSRGTRSALIVSGLILLAVGIPILVGPLAYQAGMGVSLPDDPTLLSDLRAMGGSLIGFGLLLVSSATWAQRLARGAAIAGAVLYLSYGLSRLLSMALDGLPTDVLIGSAAIELFVGGLLALVVVRGRSANTKGRLTRARSGSPAR